MNQVLLRRNGNILWASAPLIGSRQDCPQETGSVNYTLQVRGESSSYEVQRVLQVYR